MNAELLKMLTPDDLKGEQRELVDVLGSMEAYINLVAYYGGTGRLYIPQPDIIVIPIRDKLIRREYDGTNLTALARKWELTERYVQEIVKEKRLEIQRKPMDGQLTLF